MKTSKAHFAEFKSSFLAWQKALGVVEYTIQFLHRKIQNAHGDCTFAEINIGYSAKTADVTLTTEVDEEVAALFDPTLHGKHEAIHLFLARFAHLAELRHVMQSEIDDAEEQVVRVLEKVLPNLPLDSQPE